MAADTGQNVRDYFRTSDLEAARLAEEAERAARRVNLIRYPFPNRLGLTPRA